MKFEGCFTAIITPFHGTGLKTPVDWEAYEEILRFQDENGIAGIVACGTTGESPTLSHVEHCQVIEKTLDGSKALVIAGTGSNSTWEAVEMTKDAAEVGAHASLQVCPYYNKPSQDGLFKHFGAIAEAVDIPHILYNIPGRSSREIAPRIMARLMEEYSNVIGVKEATGNPDVWRAIRESCGKDFLILSGNDSDTYQLMKEYGAKGVVSVASNFAPREMVAFTRLGLKDRFPEMEAENNRLKELLDILFIDTNPIPVKEAMNYLGLKAGGYRLPMCEISPENRNKLIEVLGKYGLSKGG
ncbi:MAG: 4-hydroxy-tetrahydrodipicolinate synthase [Candidatus Hydrothermarchaeota archaeon]|nr:4-hydroxy-tetrahydrodipicolinate synthase [Candidatus Hydrothermarchaeota archaeon]